MTPAHAIANPHKRVLPRSHNCRKPSSALPSHSIFFAAYSDAVVPRWFLATRTASRPPSLRRENAH
jgi:hypothetical protein